jgi:hypothetical protein
MEAVMTKSLACDTVDDVVQAIVEVLNRVLHSRGLHFGLHEGSISTDSGKIEDAAKALAMHARGAIEGSQLDTCLMEIDELKDLLARHRLVILVRRSFVKIVGQLAPLLFSDPRQASSHAAAIVTEIGQLLVNLGLTHGEVANARAAVQAALGRLVPAK